MPAFIHTHRLTISCTRCSERVNMKRDLEVLGIHQRDMAKDEEVQLSLEQVHIDVHTSTSTYQYQQLM